jgi:hypothetical protein
MTTQTQATGVVTLTRAQFAVCVQTGLLRFMSSGGRPRWQRAPRPTEGNWLGRLEDETLGACGELALALALGKPWAGTVGTFHDEPDVSGLDVRTTTREDGSLIIGSRDPVDRYVVLVTGQPPTLTIRGYLKAADARRAEWVRDPGGLGPAWFVPQSALHPFGGRRP